MDAAESANLSISMQFGRGVELPENDGVLLIRSNKFYKFSAVIDAVIFPPPMEFTRSDGAIKKIPFAILYFGGLIENFNLHFAKFGKSLSTLGAKNPAYFGGVEIKGYDIKYNSNGILLRNGG